MKRNIFSRLRPYTLLVFFVLAGNVWADDFQVISAKELKAKMNAGEALFLLNPLSDIEFNEGHIPGSVNIPLNSLATTDKLPKDKETLIITYCLGPKWVIYKKAAGLVAKREYSSINVFRDGIPGWIKSGYSLNSENALPKIKIPALNPEKLKGMLGSVIILDIRASHLYKMGWIKGSLKVPLDQLSKRYNEIPKGKKIVVVDHAGKQVLTAGRFLKSKGYKDVNRLQGGLIACVSQGVSLEK